MAPVKGAGPVHILRESEKFHLFARGKRELTLLPGLSGYCIR